ncbi:endolysin [Mycobacterium phage MooMoo]|uniref:Lysin B n=1 Tax=Mycobacterium phage MooMoo TaxID=2108127 RepID=A0A2P1JR68_9CAUD|nr:endolysin [Mycobacterium phage MooMoo]AVO21635.1 lysin B [Mycobacterium phage MooMoo]
MRIGGQYVGLGLGDSSPEIRNIKTFMRRKFASYAGHLADTELYDEQMVAVVTEMQARYNASGQLASDKYTPGIINAETKYVMGYLQRPPGPDTRGVLLTVCGTGVPWWVGPDADTARAVENVYKWRPVGYRAAPFPMGASIAEGRAEANRIIVEERDRIEKYGLALAGYSQGAIVTSELWEYDIKPTSGPLHWAKPYVRKAVAWGNPMREIGKAWPDPGAPVSGMGRGGITQELMVDTPEWWRNYAHAGDLYTDVADDEAAENKRAIWAIVRGTKVFSGPDSILAQVLEVMGIRQDAGMVMEVMAIFKAIMDAGLFFLKGTGPHVNYNIQPAIEYLRAT